MKHVSLRNQRGQSSVWMAIILVLIGGYAVMTYVPPWHKSWKAKNVIGEVISGFSSNGITEDGIQSAVVDSLAKIGIDVGHGDVYVTINREDKKIKVEVKWKAQFNYPLTKKATHIDFLIKVKRKLS